ncbi:MAG TPA: DUF5320 domain-containing protein [Bacteroidales bacterium]|nr:DUF5320 domain-containing protein [Bacteroidales bacterium]
MPGFDRTGPEGEGPMTGRKQGRCTGRDEEQRPEGRGLGLGRGRRNRGRGKGQGRRFRGV